MSNASLLRQKSLALYTAAGLLADARSDSDQASRIWMPWLRAQGNVKPVDAQALAVNVGKCLAQLNTAEAQSLTPMFLELLSSPPEWLAASADDFVSTTARAWLVDKGPTSLFAVAGWIRAVHAHAMSSSLFQRSLQQTWDQLPVEPDLLGLTPSAMSHLVHAYPEMSFHLAKRSLKSHAAGQLDALPRLTALLPHLDAATVDLCLGMAVDSASLGSFARQPDAAATRTRKLECALAFSNSGGHWLPPSPSPPTFTSISPTAKTRAYPQPIKPYAPIDIALKYQSEDMCGLAHQVLGPEIFWARAADHIAALFDSQAREAYYVIRDARNLIPLLCPLPGMPGHVAMMLTQATCSFPWNAHFRNMPGDLQTSLNLLVPIITKLPVEERSSWKLGGFSYLGTVKEFHWPITPSPEIPVHHWVRELGDMHPLRYRARDQAESCCQVLINFMRQAQFSFPWQDSTGLASLGPEVASWFEAWHLDSLTLSTERTSLARASRL